MIIKNIKDMKNIVFILNLLIFIAVTGCTIDNYEKPQLTLTGKIVDAQTNELVESGGINAGTVVRLYEGSSVQPLNYSTLPDGTFTNSKVFSGAYAYTAEGPFTMPGTDKTNLKMDGNSDVEIKVIPNVRVKATLVEAKGTTATVKLQFEKVSTSQPLAQIGCVWGMYPNPNVLIFPGGSTLLETVTATSPTTGEKVFTLTNLKPNSTYYVRGTARTTNPGNYYNYTPQLKITTN